MAGLLEARLCQMTIAPASQLDAADPLARFRSRFVAADDPSIVAYLEAC